MKRSHIALIVEDDPATAEDLVEIVRSIGGTGVAVDNSDDALVRLQRQPFCFVLLDLQIKGAADGIKGHVQHGRGLLRKIREEYGQHNGLPFWLPVLVLSGYAREAEEAVEVMKDGASDVLQKPLKSQQVSDRIRRALEASGRERHELCHELPPEKPPNPAQEIVIAIPGDRVGRRTRVTVGSKSAKLTNEALKVLLHLAVARRKGTALNKDALGAAPDQGFKGVSRLREQLDPALDGRDIVKSLYYGNYSFTDEVVIGECSVEKLREIGDATISELAAQLQKV